MSEKELEGIKKVLRSLLLSAGKTGIPLRDLQGEKIKDYFAHLSFKNFTYMIHVKPFFYKVSMRDLLNASILTDSIRAILKIFYA